MTAGWPDRAPTIPWSVPSGRALPFFFACKKIPGPSVRRENAPQTRGCADENCGPNRTNAPCESHAIRPQPRTDQHRRRAGAIHLSPHSKHPPRPHIWKSFHVITNVGTRNARLGSFSRIFPDLTGLASEFAFQLTAKAFAHLRSETAPVMLQA